MREEVLRLAKENKLYGKTDETVEDYINKYYDKFYIYVKDKTVLGWADFWISGNTLYIHDMFCRGNILDMWKYCKNFMLEHKLSYIKFKRFKYDDKEYRRYRR